MPGGIRTLLENQRHGVLATLSASRNGWPFASLAPYALTERGEPLLLLSDLAEHTRNVRSDARVSLLIQDQASLNDPQAGARVTILGTIELVAEPELVLMQRRYKERQPQAEGYLAMSDFRLYVLRVTEARFIGGFGDMGWIDGDRLRADFAII
jgi:putative heme iron utilization protein